MTSNMNINDFQAKVMAELAEIKNLLADKGSSPSMKEKKPRKPRDPDAAPNPWIVFTGKVRAALKAANKPAGKECQQFASYLKAEFKEDAYSMEDSEILAAHADWTPPPAKPKPTEAEPAPASDSETKPKPKRVLSDEQKQKMAAGRKAAAERKKAEKAAELATKEEPEEEAPAPKVEAKPLTLKPFPFKTKKMLWDPEGNGTWLAGEGGAKGAWQGILSKDKKSIDATAKDYTA